VDERKSAEMLKVLKWFLDGDHNPDSHQNRINFFGLFTLFLETCLQIHSVVFALSRKISKEIYTKTISFLSADNKVFVTYQAQGRF